MWTRPARCSSALCCGRPGSGRVSPRPSWAATSTPAATSRTWRAAGGPPPPRSSSSCPVDSGSRRWSGASRPRPTRRQLVAGDPSRTCWSPSGPGPSTTGRRRSSTRTQAAAIAEAAGDTGRHWEALYVLAQAKFSSGDFAGAARLAEQLAEHETAHKFAVARAQALSLASVANRASDHLGWAVAFGARAVEAASAAPADHPRRGTDGPCQRHVGGRALAEESQPLPRPACRAVAPADLRPLPRA